jgi:hypothetical protein
MQSRTSWVLGGAVVLAALILGVSFGSRTAAQPRPAEPPAVGRYQLLPAGEGVGGGVVHVRYAVVDTATGQCWSLDQGEWKDLGSPARPKK